MPDPITFTTEAERLKAREQYLAIDKVAWPFEQDRSAERFDRAFPPITPPREGVICRVTSIGVLGGRIETLQVWSPGGLDGYVDGDRVRVTKVEEGQ